jgi:hypothetical protein
MFFEKKSTQKKSTTKPVAKDAKAFVPWVEK